MWDTFRFERRLFLPTPPRGRRLDDLKAKLDAERFLPTPPRGRRPRQCQIF